MFEKLAHGIPLNEAAAFFIKLRTFDKTAEEMAPPDETGALEGQFTAPVEQVLAQMASHVQRELKTQFAYMVYSHSLRDLSHNAIADQFEDHAHDETDHADWLMRRMGVLGGPINLPDIPAPNPSTDPHDIINTMIRMEQEGIESWRTLRSLVGDENPMKFKIEEYLGAEQEHLDELWQLVPHEANPAVLMQGKGSTTPVSSEIPQVPPSAPDTSPTPPDHKTAAALMRKAASELTAAGRDHIKPKNFSLSAKQSDTGKPAYPIQDKSHAANALARVKQHGSPAEKAEVYKDVARKFPELAAKSSVPAVKAKAKEKDAAGLDAGMAAAGQPPQMPPPPAPLPATGMGKQAKEERSPEDTGKERARASLSAEFEKEKGHKHERGMDLAGKFTGAALGGYGMHRYGKGNPLATLGGAALGSHLGGKYYSEVGRTMDARAHEKSAAALFKMALDSLSPAGGAPALGGGGAEEAPPEEEGVPQQAPQMDPAFAQYMQQESQGQAAEKQQEEAFYKQKFEAANQQLQAANQQMSSLQQQADATGEAQQQTMQQAQQMQQAAMSNAQAAHQAATQAMQQSMQAQQESIQQAQLAVGMRDSVHAMRQGLLQMVQQQLPPATPAETQAIQADQQAAAMGQPPGAPGGAPGQDNSQQPGPDGAPQDPNQAGQPGASPDAGTPPASATPGDGSGAGTSPSAGAGATPTMEGAQPQGEQGMQQQPPKTASAHDKLVGAILGGTVGGVGGAVASQMSNDPLRAKVKELEAKDQAGGGFINAMSLAQAKARLAVNEFGERHPIAGSAITAGMGAGFGARALPAVRTIVGG